MSVWKHDLIWIVPNVPMLDTIHEIRAFEGSHGRIWCKTSDEFVLTGETNRSNKRARQDGNSLLAQDFV
jgi:hypothetical protein